VFLFLLFHIISNFDNMKRFYLYSVFIISLLFGGIISCVSDYEPSADSLSGILVVESVISDNETIVRLSRSIGFNEDFSSSNVINNAVVSVEGDNGMVYSEVKYDGNGEYILKTPVLDLSTKYRLHIILDNEVYQSEYLSPLPTPEIDDIGSMKKGPGEPVFITVSTHDESKDGSRYYRWSYNEIWEFKSPLFANYGTIDGKEMPFDLTTPYNTFFCWGRDSSKIVLTGTSEKLSENIISNKRIVEIDPSDEKISLLYYIDVKQFQLRKESYDYLANIQKNIEQSGSIFSPIPYEMKGNIECVTDTDIPVIGYVEVSKITSKSTFMPDIISFYEPPVYDCVTLTTLDSLIPGNLIVQKPYHPSDPTWYAPARCVNCLTRGTKNKPEFWPTDSQ